jgi:hypothetical protein
MRHKKVSEPVQVYLDAPDRERLDWLTAELGATKSDVLRRALEALERDLTDPESHPLLRLCGLGAADGGPRVDYDPVVEHDRFLAEANWPAGSPKPARRRGH